MIRSLAPRILPSVGLRRPCSRGFQIRLVDLLGARRGILMRKLLFVLGIVALCSAPTWADSIEYDVNAWAEITATNGAVENMDVNFTFHNLDYQGFNEAIVDSVNVRSSGFLGTFAPLSPSGSNIFYLGLFNNPNPTTIYSFDEIDLQYPLTPGGISMPPGRNLQYLDFNFYNCQTSACTTAYDGVSWRAAAPITL